MQDVPALLYPFPLHDIKRELCAVVVPYRIPILIRESEMWELGEERPDFVLRNMVGASIDVIVTKVERTAIPEWLPPIVLHHWQAGLHRTAAFCPRTLLF